MSRICHSSKDAETLNLLKMVDDLVLASRQLELLLYGDVHGKILYIYSLTQSQLKSQCLRQNKSPLNL